MTASSGAIMEFYRQLIHELDIHIKTNSKAMMLRMIKKEISALVKLKFLSIIVISPWLVSYKKPYLVSVYSCEAITKRKES